MKKLVVWLINYDTSERLVLVLKAWRLWIVGAVMGAVIGLGVYALFPPPFRAQAVVVVDQNIEEAWIFPYDRRAFHYLGRETRKLEELAWADETLFEVVAQVGGTTVEELRGGKFMISEPGDGPWLFWAQDDDPDRAEILVSTWAGIFVENVKKSIDPAPELAIAREELDEFLAENPEPKDNEIKPFLADYIELMEQSFGISPFLEVYLSQSEALPVNRLVNHSIYLFVGSVIGAFGFVLVSMFFVPMEKEK